jgi:hypothetical protein
MVVVRLLGCVVECENPLLGGKRALHERLAAMRLPWCAIVLTLISAAIYRSLDLTRWLEFDMTASQHGEIWRPLTGHLCHYNRSHFVGDAAAFLIWASAVELVSRRLLGAALIGTPLALAAWLYASGAAPLTYRGLSAIDCALASQLFALASLHEVVERTAWLRALLLAIAVAVTAKSGFEFVTGHAILAPDLGECVRLLPSAHVLGVCVGLATALVPWRTVLGRFWQAGGQ